MTDSDFCKTCRFFDSAIETLVGENWGAGACRRHAPRVQFEKAHNIKKKRWLMTAYAIWPLVAPDDWCGEHAARLDGEQ